MNSSPTASALPQVASPLLRLGGDSAVLVAQLQDNDASFCPFAQPPVPDTTLDLGVRPVGGLGLHLVKRFADAVSYEWHQGVKRTALRLKLEAKQSEQ